MKKIIYINKEVQIGDMVAYNGVTIEVTDKSVEANPSIFKVVDKSLELLDKAKRDYPAGTVFKSLRGKICTVKNKPCYSIGAYNSILIDNTYVYRDGRWAEVLPLKFITEDGVSIYGDMKTYLVYPNDNGNITFCHSLWNGDSERRGSKYFYHKDNALAYVKKHKEKTLEDYENNLFESMQANVYSSNNRHYYSVWGWIKDNEPKLYYSKILQLIADDLNDGKRIHRSGDTSYHISDEFSVNVHCGGDEGCVYFKSIELAEKARDILGDKVKYLFNN